uniref:Transmembrane protein n=1 Tax=Kalanchoe fedtschenkoi TaxID=63787 RepID=A0A7N0R985_KALFE
MQMCAQHRICCSSQIRFQNRRRKNQPQPDPIPSRAEMDGSRYSEKRVSPAQAVLLGALSPGVNAPTWAALQSALLMLAVCLAAMLGLAFSSSDSWMVLHVALLVSIAGGLFLLLSWFLAETGLVTVEHQMKEMGLDPANNEERTKKFY